MSRRVTDHKGRTTYMITRGEDVRPTVLVHGGLSEASEWSLMAAKLAGHVVIPDRPGCGLSYPINYLGLDYRRAATDWLRDVTDAIGPEEVDLVGNSMGGFFSMAFATAHPERVRRLVLVGAPAGLHKHIPLPLRLWGNPVIGPILMRLKVTRPKDAETLRNRIFAPMLVAHPEALPVDVLEVALAGGTLPGADRAAFTMLRTVLTLRGWRDHLMLHHDMALLQVPTLFVWGAADAFEPPTSGHEIAARMPDARIEVIREAGHVPYLDQPDAVAAAITGFLSD